MKRSRFSLKFLQAQGKKIGVQKPHGFEKPHGSQKSHGSLISLLAQVNLFRVSKNLTVHYNEYLPGSGV